MTTIAIDPGPTRSGYVVVRDNDIIAFGKATLKEIKLLAKHNADRFLIEITDFPIFNAGESFRDTNIIIGRILEFFKDKIVITIGRKEAVNYFKLKNDKEVRAFLKSKGYNNLSNDSWQAMLIYYYYNIYAS